MDFVANENDGGKTACAKAIHGFNREFDAEHHRRRLLRGLREPLGVQEGEQKRCLTDLPSKHRKQVSQKARPAISPGELFTYMER